MDNANASEVDNANASEEDSGGYTGDEESVYSGPDIDFSGFESEISFLRPDPDGSFPMFESDDDDNDPEELLAPVTHGASDGTVLDDDDKDPEELLAPVTHGAIDGTVLDDGAPPAIDLAPGSTGIVGAIDDTVLDDGAPPAIDLAQGSTDIVGAPHVTDTHNALVCDNTELEGNTAIYVAPAPSTSSANDGVEPEISVLMLKMITLVIARHRESNDKRSRFQGRWDADDADASDPDETDYLPIGDASVEVALAASDSDYESNVSECGVEKTPLPPVGVSRPSRRTFPVRYDQRYIECINLQNSLSIYIAGVTRKYRQDIKCLVKPRPVNDAIRSIVLINMKTPPEWSTSLFSLSFLLRHKLNLFSDAVKEMCHVVHHSWHSFNFFVDCVGFEDGVTVRSDYQPMDLDDLIKRRFHNILDPVLAPIKGSNVSAAGGPGGVGATPHPDHGLSVLVQKDKVHHATVELFRRGEGDDATFYFEQREIQNELDSKALNDWIFDSERFRSFQSQVDTFLSLEMDDLDMQTLCEYRNALENLSGNVERMVTFWSETFMPCVKKVTEYMCCDHHQHSISMETVTLFLEIHQRYIWTCAKLYTLASVLDPSWKRRRSCV